MTATDLKPSAPTEVNLGQQMYEMIAALYPICRSITGDGFRATLRGIQEHLPLEVYEVPSGTPAFDWTVPNEWNIRDAYVKNSQGERVIDFQKSNLHVVSYSIPVHKKMGLSELKEHLISLPDYPDRIPYRTSYYNEKWAFCVSHEQLLALPEDEYEVVIDSTLEPGHLTYGEYFLPGETVEEVLISCHACHPSLCNDNLSGIAMSVFLAKQLAALPRRRYSYRFIFIPGTIGSITWLSRNEERIPQIKHGLVITGVGDPGAFTYKKSRRGDTEIDRAVMNVLKSSGQPHEVIEFFPYGYDERQYCSPAFNMPVGCFMRSSHGRYSEYHTSADNLDFVRPECLEASLKTCLAALYVIEHNKTYLNQSPKCEPQLGKRGLYSALGGQTHQKSSEMAMLWILNLSDGHYSLLDISNRSGLPFEIIAPVATLLAEHGLLKEC